MATDGRADERRGIEKQKDRGRLQPRSTVASVWFCRSANHEKGREVGGTEGGKDGEIPPLPQMMPPYTTINGPSQLPCR